MYYIYICIYIFVSRFFIPSCNGLVVTAFKPEAEESARAVAIMLFSIVKLY